MGVYGCMCMIVWGMLKGVVYERVESCRYMSVLCFVYEFI